MPETVTLTFGESAENHKGMQMIGKLASTGLSPQELEDIRTRYETLGFKCDLYNLDTLPILATLNDDLARDQNKNKLIRKDARLLVIKKAITNASELYKEQLQFPRDTKALMYGRVVNKRARHNLCFSDFDQVADYANGKGTVINFTRTPLLAAIRKALPKITGLDKLAGLQCEANYYYDISKTYIGWHGDTERKIVVGVRLGATFPLHYQWYYKGAPFSDKFTVQLEDGDMYFMSDKATGNDWKHSSIPTLRHAAGYV